MRSGKASNKLKYRNVCVMFDYYFNSIQSCFFKNKAETDNFDCSKYDWSQRMTKNAVISSDSNAGGVGNLSENIIFKVSGCWKLCSK